jgi:hypothetical protein
MAGVKGRSGRQAGGLLSETSVRRLHEGLDLKTAAGNQELTIRAGRLLMTGKMAAHIHGQIVKAVQARRALIVDAEVDARVTKILEARDEIVSARGGSKRANAMVGPPPDDDLGVELEDNGTSVDAGAPGEQGVCRDSEAGRNSSRPNGS